MSKGLKLTLMTVAAAMMAAQAMAMAPVIGDIPSPVVGDSETASPANTFVYPDAFNLADYVTDDTSPSASIVWSFATAGTSLFAINGTGPLDLGTESPVTPGAKAVNTAVRNSEVNPDSNVATLTIRDVNLTPLGSTTQGNPPMGGDSQVLTLFASDGSTYSQKDVMFYAQAGSDHLSVPGGQWTEVIAKTFSPGPQGWVSTNWGGVTFSTSAGTALCIGTALTGTNAGYWRGPYGELELVKNNIYRVRLQMQGSQSGAGANSDVPFWDMVVNNFDGANGMNLYGMNYFFLDNAGRANAVTQNTGGKEFQFWWCPSPVSTTQWNNEAVGGGPFAAANAANKNSFLEFRILDVPSNSGITADSDQGSICIENLVIERMDISNLVVKSTPYNASSNLTDGRTATSGNLQWPSIVAGASFTFTGGAVSIGSADAAGQASMLGAMEPGDTNLNLGNTSTMGDNFPVPVVPQKAYLISYTMSATATDANNPPDVFWLGADMPTNELICLSYVTAAGGNLSAMPKATAQDYKALFYSNYGTLTQGAAYSTIRPRFMIANTGDLGGAGNNNSGKVTISAIKVEQVDTQ